MRTDTSIPPHVSERFWTKVLVGDDADCWPWTGAVSRNGYGSFKVFGKATSAHRVAHWLSSGNPGVGLLIRHRCDNRVCCNPGHLETGSHIDNMRDMVERGRARNRPSIGELNGNAKLNGEAVKRVRELIRLGQKNTAIAKRFNVTHQMISRIRRGTSWTSVPSPLASTDTMLGE